MTGLGPPTTRFLRRHGGRWLDGEIPSPCRPPQPITHLSTGYWWNGHGYHETEREARTHAWLMDHSVVMSMRSAERDPQLRRDVTWQLVAAVTVVPVAALPLLFVAGAIYAAATGSALSLVLVVGSLAVAPFAWRILSPVALRYLAPDPNATAESRIARLESIRADLTHTNHRPVIAAADVDERWNAVGAGLAGGIGFAVRPRPLVREHARPAVVPSGSVPPRPTVPVFEALATNAKPVQTRRSHPAAFGRQLGYDQS